MISERHNKSIGFSMKKFNYSFKPLKPNEIYYCSENFLRLLCFYNLYIFNRMEIEMASIGPPMKAELGHMDIELISMELEAPRVNATDLTKGPFTPGNLSYGDVTLKIVEDPDNPIENVVPKTEKISITFPGHMTRMHFAKRSLTKPIVKKAHWVSDVKRKPKKVKYEGTPGSIFEFLGKCHAEGNDTIRIECVESCDE